MTTAGAALAAAVLTIGIATSAHAASEHEAGRTVYNLRCYFCHGYSGDAKTLAATYLSPKPRNFTLAPALPRKAIVTALREGRRGTAMQSFAGTLSEAQMQAVAAFVEKAFVQDMAHNTAYHTAANGWPDHRRYAAAFPFATGVLAVDAPIDTLDSTQQRGRAMYLTSCISCHDRGRVTDEGPVWRLRPVSYPRMGFVPGQAAGVPIDAVSQASVYGRHDVAPRVAGLSARGRRGEKLFQANCAFCHGADGTGRNWIGQFMEPKARDLTAYTPRQMPMVLLRKRVRDGLPGTSMPAWGAVLSAPEIDAVAAYVTQALMRPGGADR